MRPRTTLGIEFLEDRSNPASFDPNHVLVTYADTADHLADLSITPILRGVARLADGVYSVALNPGANVQQMANVFAGLPGVRHAGPDYRLEPAAVSSNDPMLSQQWSYSRTLAANAWSASTGTGNTIVAVIDTGIDAAHPDLAPNLWHNPREVAGNGVDDDANGFIDDVVGANFMANTGTPADDAGHGTHVAGIIGAAGNNDTGIAGVLWRAKIMALKFMDAAGGLTSDAVRAVDYAVRNGAKVINASWGGNAADAALNAAFERARAAGVIVVTAAGNTGRNIDASPFYPASTTTTFDNVVSVAATTSQDTLASFSNFGAASVTLAAPGESILSTVPGGGYALKSGTSMAAPFVAGAVALTWDAHPNWSYQQVLAKLRLSVDTLPALAGKTSTGGRLNLAKLLDAVSPPPVDRTGPRATGVNILGPTADTINSVRLAFSEPIDPSTIVRSVAIHTPGGPVIPAVSAAMYPNSNNTLFDVQFGQTMSAPGAYTVTVSYLIRDQQGNALDQNGNGVNGEYTDWFVPSTTLPTTAVAGFTVAATGLPRTIADQRTTRVELRVDRDWTLGSLTVRLDASHARTSDLQIRLTSPTGQRVVLFNRAAGASLSGASFSTPSSLNPLAGINARGVWALEIFDLAAGVSGTLTSVSLQFGV